MDLDEPVRQGALATLDSDELGRVSRLRTQTLRRRARHRFALLRTVLSGVLGVPATEVAFVNGVCGKPRVAAALDRGGSHQGISFNLSHSENILAIVLGFGVDTGVDVEVLDRQKGTPEFYSDWTRREAASKLVGTGIAWRGGLGYPPSMSVRSFVETVRGREVTVSVAVSEQVGLPDSQEGVTAENLAIL